MAIQRKSQIPKAPERSVLDSIVAGPASTLDDGVGNPPAATTPATPATPAQIASEPLIRSQVEQPSAQAVDQNIASLQPPVRRQRKPARIVYTSKMDPDLKAWAMSYKKPGREGEDFVEVVEQALWVLRLARSGQMADAVAALEQAAVPFE